MEEQMRAYLMGIGRALLSGIIISGIGGILFFIIGSMVKTTSLEAISYMGTGIIFLGALCFLIYGFLFASKKGGKGIMKEHFPTEEEKLQKELDKKKPIGQFKEKVKNFYNPLKVHNALLISSIAIIFIGTTIEILSK